MKRLLTRIEPWGNNRHCPAHVGRHTYVVLFAKLNRFGPDRLYPTQFSHLGGFFSQSGERRQPLTLTRTSLLPVESYQCTWFPAFSQNQP
jgi:hypothetical protein